jgi:hypothetical protein
MICSCSSNRTEKLIPEGAKAGSITLKNCVFKTKTATFNADCGTRIAQIYAYQHPNNLHRSVMVGVNPPGRFIWEPEIIDKQIVYYSRLWSQDSMCRSRTGDLAKTIRNVLQKVPSHWLIFPIDPGKVKLITFALLYHRNTAAQVFDTFVASSDEKDICHLPKLFS